ncbi:hypothetical protein TNCV_5074561 [Trichonephila clavipes]|nr:hypothetical protein TNCV_5074561 [Trichonephila clavipes]
MHFAFERLFYEEDREMFLVPGKGSLYRKIRNTDVRMMEPNTKHCPPPSSNDVLQHPESNTGQTPKTRWAPSEMSKRGSGQNRRNVA